jgi:hypothetical protein
MQARPHHHEGGTPFGTGIVVHTTFVSRDSHNATRIAFALCCDFRENVHVDKCCLEYLSTLKLYHVWSNLETLLVTQFKGIS